MSDFDVTPSEMKKIANISDSDLEAVREGRVPEGDPDLGAIARFVREFDEAVPETSTASVETAHVAAMMEAFHLMAEKGESAEAPTSKADGPAERVSELPKPGRIAMIKMWFATRTAKVVAGAIAGVLAFAGIAVAGGLPNPIQDAVSGALGSAGIHVPAGTEQVEVPTVQLAPVPSAPDTPAVQTPEPPSTPPPGGGGGAPAKPKARVEADDDEDEDVDEADEDEDEDVDEADDDEDENDDEHEDAEDDDDADEADEADDEHEDEVDDDRDEGSSQSGGESEHDD